ncbi:uncharacterized protein [Dysidea avara]|uniref:uncharacterized protein n=1 Tax=Dysidea avara TaxID=196820 RepID=UPI00332B4B72
MSIDEVIDLDSDLEGEPQRETDVFNTILGGMLTDEVIRRYLNLMQVEAKKNGKDVVIFTSFMVEKLQRSGANSLCSWFKKVLATYSVYLFEIPKLIQNSLTASWVLFKNLLI